ncbi:NUDIX hydrolase [Novosphingobium sp. JCM 18896]|uniref:NUDIX hydrolase n=1 Tax=Novosphingobium sp. JCM 18896 TaxID=2989731 RepID=UPI002222ABCA|nr:NUDIX domain-containing protein [Novosphingobium sp. JCM 18896]MCW1427862.1 NUDIX domain-containing protein [Novosphingobium sp. JCM 18896]
MNAPVQRRIRRAARVLLFGADGRLLLFRYTPSWSKPFWTAPGGECDPGEDFPAAARRELFEETGFEAEPVAMDYVREDEFETLQREPIRSLEHFFWAVTDRTEINVSGHTELEQSIMQGHRWFTPEEVADWHEPIFPQNIVNLIRRARAQREGTLA